MCQQSHNVFSKFLGLPSCKSFSRSSQKNNTNPGISFKGSRYPLEEIQQLPREYTVSTFWCHPLLLLLVLFVPGNCYTVKDRYWGGRWQRSVTQDVGDSVSSTESFTNATVPCEHGRVTRSAIDQQCQCYPCWSGSDCNTYVDNYAPRFLVHRATAVVPVNTTGSAYRAWASDDDLGLTCPLGPGESARCPCASFSYQLFSPSGDHRFALHPSTGLLVRRRANQTDESNALEEGNTYNYKLMVQSVLVPGYSKERLYDILDLEIFVGPPTLEKTPWI
ncbi:hypothetical protein FHG87_003103 [Trinorchestia longiramus]|nr:hypothetical protein FHG87_003103 [Trinorchestia longiramus]